MCIVFVVFKCSYSGPFTFAFSKGSIEFGRGVVTDLRKNSRFTAAHWRRNTQQWRKVFINNNNNNNNTKQSLGGRRLLEHKHMGRFNQEDLTDWRVCCFGVENIKVPSCSHYGPVLLSEATSPSKTFILLLKCTNCCNKPAGGPAVTASPSICWGEPSGYISYAIKGLSKHCRNKISII